MRAPTTPLALAVDHTSRTTLPVQIAEQIRHAVRAGALRVGDRLPSSRALADELGVSRAVVEQAYDQLHAGGWLLGRRGSGTYVHDVAAAIARPRQRVRRTSAAEPRTDGHAGLSRSGTPTAATRSGTPTAAARSDTPAAAARSDARTGTPTGDAVGGTAAQRPLVRLDTGTPWRDPRHDDGWRRAWRDVSAARPPSGYPEPAGIPELREAVAAHVARHRGIVCTPDQVLITSGTTHGLGMLLDTLPVGTVALEDPGYRAAAATVAARGWRLLDVPVDSDGIDVTAIRRARRDDLRGIYVTPAHQHPLGMTLTPQRRRSLLEEAVRRDAIVVEDDYDSEFRYDVAPLPALAQLGLDRVAFLGTASKSVLPGLRVGWLVSTEARVAEIAARREERHDHPCWPVQYAFWSMLRDGYVDRLLRSARRVYAERSREVTQRLGEFGRVMGGVAGMYTVLHLEPELTARAIRAAADAGFELPSLAAYCRSTRLSGIVFGFGGVSDGQFDRALDAVEFGLCRG
jgi:GntR family transcriptional regulator / MocR family aminotransferase